MGFTIREECSVFVVCFQYSPEYVHAIKSIGQGAYDPQNKTWRFPLNDTMRIKLHSLANFDQVIWLDSSGRVRFIQKKGEVNEGSVHIGDHQPVPDIVRPNGRNPFLNMNSSTDKGLLAEKVRTLCDAYAQAHASLQQELILAGYSLKTKKAYEGHVRRFLEQLGRNVHPGHVEIRAYVERMLNEKELSHSFANQFISAMTFFCNRILREPMHSFHVPKRSKSCRRSSVRQSCRNCSRKLRISSTRPYYS